ncbi:MAG TPA: tripartite tricarboxylate transporter substrate-binding protein [Burkholderiales bacterium]|nr:tripartite tricarboxylate transporter substrate-binding protein [Burkholderiales bacterium]
MQFNQAIKLAALALPVALAASPAPAAEDTFPDKPIRLVIGSTPGSGPDIMSRLLAERLYKVWNQRVVVDSRAGVSGIVSAETTLRANPDGYTWMMLTSQLFVATSVYPDLKFNLDKDFVSMALIGTVPFVQMVNNQLPVKSIQELIALAKKQPGKLRYGSAGTGASEHLSGVMFLRLTGTDMLHVPYKGVPQSIADTMANEVQVTYAVVPAALPQVQAGRIRAIGVTSPKRSFALPDVPAIAEVVPGYSMLGWYSLVAPKGTPKAIIAKSVVEILKALKEPEYGVLLRTTGVDFVGGGPAELDAWRRDQRKTISELVKAAGVTATQ